MFVDYGVLNAMIIDMLPNQYEALAAQHSFRPWQTGLLGDMLSETNNGKCLIINMGSDAGHTYFARAVASSSFPFRTKVYVTRQEAFSEFANLLFNENAVHEPIELLDTRSYIGNPVDFVIVDMSGEAVRRFKNELGGIMTSVGVTTRMILLQPDHAVVPDFSKF